MTKKWNIANDNKTRIMMSEMKLFVIWKFYGSNLHNYIDACNLIKGDIVTTPVAFQRCAPFTKCITKINGTAIDHVEDLDLVMPMYNRIEYS